MSRNSNRSVKKKLSVPSACTLPEINSNNSLIESKSTFVKDIYNARINKFIADEDFSNFLLISSDNSSESQSSSTDDLEVKSTKVIQAEFDLVEKLLYGEAQYDNYNKELDEWKENFKYLRISGSKIKPLHLRKQTNDDVTEEIFAEHRDLSSLNYVQVSLVNEMKNKVKQSVLEKLISIAKTSQFENIEDSQLKYKQIQRESRKNSLPPRQTISGKSLLPVKVGRVNYVQGANTLMDVNKKHRIIRSNISSAKWQRNNREDFDLPVVPSRRDSRSSNIPFLQKDSKSLRSFTLPPIKGESVKRDKTVVLRSRSCNAQKRDSVISKSKESSRTCSSSVTDS